MYLKRKNKFKNFLIHNGWWFYKYIQMYKKLTSFFSCHKTIKTTTLKHKHMT